MFIVVRTKSSVNAFHMKNKWKIKLPSIMYLQKCKTEMYLMRVVHVRWVRGAMTGELKEQKFEREVVFKNI
jgi:hypothetical protein